MKRAISPAKSVTLEPVSVQRREAQTRCMSYTVKCASQGAKPEMAEKQAASLMLSASRSAGVEVLACALV